MNIGEKIKDLRRSRSMTQEALAEYLDISAQAVSRWETGLANPDVCLLPSLANLFGVTTDALLGMDEIRSQAYLNETYRLAQQYIAENRYDEAVMLVRSALKTFPNNYGLMSTLAQALSFGDTSTAEGMQSANEAIILCQRVLENSTSEKLRSTTRANLCCLFQTTGAYAEAVALGRTLPHVWESREMILPELLAGQEATDYLIKAVYAMLALICKKIDTVTGKQTDMKKIIAIGPENISDLSETKEAMLERITVFLNSQSFTKE